MEKKYCKVNNICGGCSYINNSYSEQLSKKQRYVDNLLNPFCKVENIISMTNPYHYRCKVHSAFGYDKNGIISGTYQPSSHKIVPIEECLIDNELADQIIFSIRLLLKSFKLKAYDENKGVGCIRHVMVRVGYYTNEVMVVLVTNGYTIPSKNNFIKELIKKHPEISTIVQNINSRYTSMVLGDKNITLYGKGYINDICLGYTFRISPNSFYQINPVIAELLYSKAIELLDIKNNEIVLDAYCGTGTIGIIASRKAQKVYGIELNKQAIKDAIINSKQNKIGNIEFINVDAADISSYKIINNKVDVLIMDPPRSGSNEDFINVISILKPKKIAYISCNPETLIRDLSSIQKIGYLSIVAVPFDMFPFTQHVETVVLLSQVGL